MIKSIRNKYSLIIYICIGIFAFYGTVGLSTFSMYYPDLNHFISRFMKVVRFILIAIVIDDFLHNGVFLKKIAIFCILVFVVAFSKTETFKLFDLLFIPFLLSNYLKTEKVYKIFFWGILFGIVIVYLFFCGHVTDTLLFRKFGGITIHTLGFRHPNFCAFSLLMLGVLYFLIREKITFWDSVLILGFGAVCTYLTLSRTSFFIWIGLFLSSILCIFINSIYKKNRRLVFYLTVLFYFFLIFIFYFFSFSELFRYSFFEKYFGTFASRLYMGKDAFLNYGISLLGQNVKFVGDYEAFKGARYFIVDCLYMYLPVVAGIIPTLIFIFSHILAFKYTIYAGNLKLLLILILFAVYELSEGSTYHSSLGMFVFIYPFSLILQEMINNKKQFSELKE